MKTIVGLFETYAAAQAAIQKLEELGYSVHDMNVVAPESVVKEHPNEVVEGAGEGAAVGGLAGLLIGLSALVVPGIGTIVATASILSSTAIGAGVGATAGGFIGALVELGIPEKEVRTYVEAVREGGIMVTVPASTTNQESQIEDVMKEYNALEVKERLQA
ncbi:MAG TPA: hypothetical protein VLG69_00120 [Candidatus Andersenbacteria bacterium]|nr:hypothetical protein [Candidatus Andersenbacteria bacterium]